MQSSPTPTTPSPSFTIVGHKSSPKGRSLQATRAFAPGDQIALFTDALVCLPAGPSAKSICNACLTPPPASAAGAAAQAQTQGGGHAVKLCTGCRFVGYCSAACQRAHWGAIHKRECRALKRVRAKVNQDWLPTAVRAVVQILLRLKEEGGGEEGGGKEAEMVRAAVEGLEGHVDRFRQHKVWKDIELQALAGVTYAGMAKTEENLSLAAEILCKVSEGLALRGSGKQEGPCTMELLMMRFNLGWY